MNDDFDVRAIRDFKGISIKVKYDKSIMRLFRTGEVYCRKFRRNVERRRKARGE